jgi:hypothetical protein
MVIVVPGIGLWATRHPPIGRQRLADGDTSRIISHFLLYSQNKFVFLKFF